MLSPASVRHLGRRAHYLALWMVLGGVAIASFRPLRGVPLRSLLATVVLLAAYAIVRTRDGGHLARPRLLDVALAFCGAATALALARGLHWSPEVTASVIGLIGALTIRAVDHELHYFEAPLFCGTFVGISAAGAIGGAVYLLGGAVVAGLLW